MTLEAGKEMDRRCVWGWLNDVYRNPKVAFNTYSDEQQIEFAHDALALLKEQPEIVRCLDCKHGSIYMTEDVCGKTLIECNHPELGDNIAIHAWDWFCADGERK